VFVILFLFLHLDTWKKEEDLSEWKYNWIDNILFYLCKEDMSYHHNSYTHISTSKLDYSSHPCFNQSKKKNSNCCRFFPILSWTFYLLFQLVSEEKI
jgi:hypothetical protein